MNAKADVIRVGLVDDHVIERQGLRALIEAHQDMRVVLEASDGLEAMRAIAPADPHLVITESIMPTMNGMELTCQLRRRHPHIKVIVLTRNERHDCVLRLVQAGADGYLFKTVSADDLVAAVRAVHSGRRVLQPPALEAVLHDYLQLCRDSSREVDAVRLTTSERRILKLIATSHSNEEIAGLLHSSPRTIATHRANMMGKLGTHKVVDLVRYAIRAGLVSE